MIQNWKAQNYSISRCCMWSVPTAFCWTNTFHHKMVNILSGNKVRFHIFLRHLVIFCRKFDLFVISELYSTIWIHPESLKSLSNSSLNVSCNFCVIFYFAARITRIVCCDTRVSSLVNKHECERNGNVLPKRGNMLGTHWRNFFFYSSSWISILFKTTRSSRK